MSREGTIERRLAAILAADVAGYSRLMGQDEVATLNALKAHRRELVDPPIDDGALVVETLLQNLLEPIVGNSNNLVVIPAGHGARPHQGIDNGLNIRGAQGGETPHSTGVRGDGCLDAGDGRPFLAGSGEWSVASRTVGVVYQ